MEKKIYRHMFLVGIMSIVLITLLLSMLFSLELSVQSKNEIKNKGMLIEKVLEDEKNPFEKIESFHLNQLDNMRITLIEKSGKVIYDNYAEHSKLENHADREEVKEAFKVGVGESERLSQSLGEKTYYYALAVNDNLVVRVAKTTSSIYGILFRTIPFIFGLVILMAIVCYIMSKKLTKRIIDPINNFSFEKNYMPYDELSVFLNYIKKQKLEIEKQKEELEKRAYTISLISENMEEGILLIDKTGTVIIGNKGACKIFNEDEKIEGKNIIEVTRNIRFIDQSKRTLEGENDTLDFEFNEKTYSVYFASIEDNGALILFADVTKKARAEKIRREFSANVSHELKTPLTSILGFSELIENNIVPCEDIQNFAGKIKVETNRLIELIDDIIKISQLDEKNSKVELEEINMRNIVNEVVGSLSNKAKEHNVDLKVECKKEIAIGNSQMIYELIYNLVDNGIKYNKENGEVKVSIEGDMDGTSIKVKDTGIGVSEEDKERVFERFYRVDKSRSKKTGGTGLGLSIVKHVVNYHNGSIKFESELDKGSEVTVCI